FLKTCDDHLSLIRRVDSEWCGPIVDTGYYKTEDPYKDMAAVAPYAVNWQIKESPFGVTSDVRTDLIRLLTLIRQAGYRGYLPIETLSAPGQDYNPFEIVPKFLDELRQAVAATTSVASPVASPVVADEPITPPTAPDPNIPSTGAKKKGGKKKSPL
ncbi:MAG TPA: hypothetical protein VGL71_04705, partial [Urbifossiella sp.]